MTAENKPELTQDQKVKAISFVVVVIGLVIFYFVGCGDEPQEKKAHTKSDALIASIQFVKKELKAPATADFNYGSEQSVTQVNDSVFMVNSYVDAENSFGAKLRNTYTCKIIFIGDSLMQCQDLNIQAP
jgi:hypothetical protein